MSQLKEFENVLAHVAEGYLGPATANPFIKWAGGKRTLVPHIAKSMPGAFNDYHEPFLGGGAVFFALEQRMTKAHLSDINLDLVLTYKALQDDPQSVIAHLTEHASRHNKIYYKTVRNQHNETNVFKLAARFIYLNKTCFNGLYRVNSQGKFNVPVGNYKNPKICDPENLANVSIALKKASIQCKTFSDIEVGHNDLVYCDPPYDETYTGYTKDGFSKDDQVALRNKCVEWMKSGAFVIVSNSDTSHIRSIYSQFRMVEVEALRSINCKGDARGKEGELLIYGYANA